MDIEQVAYELADGNLDETALTEGILALVMAERERAAKAAEQRGRELGEPAIGSDIANTIRQPLAAPAPVGP